MLYSNLKPLLFCPDSTVIIIFSYFLQARSSTGSPLSQFLYGPDPLASPPPAHMGTYLDKGKKKTIDVCGCNININFCSFQ